MKKVLSIVLLSASFTVTHAQLHQPIEIGKRGMSTYYRHDGSILKQKDIKNIVQYNPEASRQIKAARVHNAVGTVFSFAGGFCLGYSLGMVVAGKTDNIAPVAGVGAGLIGVSIPFAILSGKKTKKAVELYNEGITNVAPKTVSLRMGTTSTGWGLALGF